MTDRGIRYHLLTYLVISIKVSFIVTCLERERVEVYLFFYFFYFKKFFRASATLQNGTTGVQIVHFKNLRMFEKILYEYPLSSGVFTGGTNQTAR